MAVQERDTREEIRKGRDKERGCQGGDRVKEELRDKKEELRR